VWCIPLGLSTAELSSAMPSNDGFILWIKTAFGPFWGYLAGIFSWGNQVFDEGMYPILFMNYIDKLIPKHVIDNPVIYYSIQFAVVIGRQKGRTLSLPIFFFFFFSLFFFLSSFCPNSFLISSMGQ
jgi:amino acid transporter